MQKSPDRTLATALLAILFFHMICESMVIPVLAPTLASPISEAHDMLLGFSPRLHKFFYGISLAIYPIAIFICAPLLGSLSDTIGRKPVLTAALIGTVAGSIAQGFGMEFLSLPIFIVGRILVGASAGVDGVIQAALLDKCSTQAQKNRYLGMTLLAMSLGFILGPAFSASMIDENATTLAWSIPFFVLAICFSVTIPVLNVTYGSRRARPLKQSTQKVEWFKGLRDIMKLKNASGATRLLSIFSLNQIAGGIMVTIIPLLLIQDFSFSVKKTAVFMSVMGVFSALVFAFGDRLIARFSPFAMLRATLLTSAFCVIIAATSPFEAVMWAVTILFPAGFSMSYFALISIFSQSVPKEHSGWMMSVMSALWGLTSGIGMALCGFLSGISDILSMAVCALIAAGAFALSFGERSIPEIKL